MTRQRMTVIDAARDVKHSHRGLGHGQEGNPYYGWSDDCRFACHLCLALMVEEGIDVGLAFTSQLPFRIHRYNLHFTRYAAGRDSEAEWWKNAYLTTLAYTSNPFDRVWMREGLADSLRRGTEERAVQNAIRYLATCA